MRHTVSGSVILILAIFLFLPSSGMAASTKDPVEAARLKMLEEDRKAETAALRKMAEKTQPLSAAAKNAGFIVLSEDVLSYSDAVAFCKYHGGKLPRIDKKASAEFGSYRGVPIEGFGYGDRSWDEIGMPRGLSYWTGTKYENRLNYCILEKFGKVTTYVRGIGAGDSWAACVRK